MNHRTRLLIAGLFFVATAFGCGQDSAAPPLLSIESSDSTEVMRAQLVLPEETVEVVSRLTTEVVDSQTVSIRETTATAEDGTVYATLRTKLDDDYTTGAFDGKTFGTIDSAETDMDSSYWRGVAGSHAAVVVHTLSGAAADLVARDSTIGANVDALTHVSRMAFFLDQLAVDPLIQKSLSCPIRTGIESWVTAGVSSCSLKWRAYTIQWPGFDCPDKMYVQLYDSAGHLLKGAVSIDDAEVTQSITTSHVRGTYCRLSRHWTTGTGAKWYRNCRTDCQ